MHDDGFVAVRYAVTAVAAIVGALIPISGLASGELPVGALPVVLPFFVLWGVGIWRIVLVGVYVSDFGVKVRKVFWTHRIPWSRVERAWAGPAAHHDAWQIWITVRDPARDIETPLWRKGSRRTTATPSSCRRRSSPRRWRRSTRRGSRATRHRCIDRLDT